jgi:hypothetical protein
LDLEKPLGNAEPMFTDLEEPTTPDPESDSTFDPRYHDLAATIELGVRHLNVEADNAFDDYTANACSLAVSAFDYLTDSIGLNVRDLFHRWRKVPVVFMPSRTAME